MNVKENKALLNFFSNAGRMILRAKPENAKEVYRAILADFPKASDKAEDEIFKLIKAIMDIKIHEIVLIEQQKKLGINPS